MVHDSCNVSCFACKVKKKDGNGKRKRIFLRHLLSFQKNMLNFATDFFE